MQAEGYFGKILRVDLSKGNIRTEALEQAAAERFIGGSGLGTKILLEETTSATDPLGPDNLLIFATGPLTGTSLFNSDRFDLVSKSPLTSIYAESSAGGYWGGKFKRCGFDALVITGRAARPVYLYMDNERAEVRDAGELWGKETFEAIDLLRQWHGEGVKAASIGTAGENGVLLANIITDGYHGRALGRCGLGAVMGAKLLKAVAVNGSREIQVADPVRLRALVKKLGPIMRENPGALREGGTSVGVQYCDEIGNLPVKNWVQASFPEGARKLTGMTLAETLLKGRYHCGKCVINCGRVVEAADGPYRGRLTAGSEYETVGLLGTNLLIDDLPTVLAANQLCNRYGLDSISVGGVIGFAMEAWEKGLIGPKDTGGIQLTWGNGPAVLSMIERIAQNRGFGTILARGVKRASAHLGCGAEDFALEVKGLEPPAHDPRAKMTVALGFATSNRGACHLAGFTHDFEDGAFIADLGLPVMKDRFTTEGKAENVVVMQNLMSLFDSLVCCKFGIFGGLTVDPLIEGLNAVTGWDLDRTAFFKTGERIFNLKRLYNNRLGVTAGQDTLPKRMLLEPRGGGTRDHLPQLSVMLQDYYRLRGWNQTTGIPEPEKLAHLGLQEYRL